MRLFDYQTGCDIHAAIAVVAEDDPSHVALVKLRATSRLSIGERALSDALPSIVWNPANRQSQHDADLQLQQQHDITSSLAGLPDAWTAKSLDRRSLVQTPCESGPQDYVYRASSDSSAVETPKTCTARGTDDSHVACEPAQISQRVCVTSVATFCDKRSTSSRSATHPFEKSLDGFDNDGSFIPRCPPTQFSSYDPTSNREDCYELAHNVRKLSTHVHTTSGRLCDSEHAASLSGGHNERPSQSPSLIARPLSCANDCKAVITFSIHGKRCARRPVNIMISKVN